MASPAKTGSGKATPVKRASPVIKDGESTFPFSEKEAVG